MLGTDYSSLAEDIASALEVSCELDPRDLVLPGVLLTPGPIEFDRLADDTASAELEAWIVASDSNPVTALDELTELLLKLRRYFQGALREAQPMTLTLSNQSPDPLPAFRCPIPIDLTFKE